MSLLDGLLGDLGGNATVQNLAAKVGMNPDQIESAIAGLAQAHMAPTDTVATASDRTGVPQDKLHEILAQLGGEGALGQLAGMMGHQGGGQPGGGQPDGEQAGGGQQGGLGGMLGGLAGKFFGGGGAAS